MNWCAACLLMGLKHRVHRDGLCVWHRDGQLLYGTDSVRDAMSKLGPSYKLDRKRFWDTFGERLSA